MADDAGGYMLLCASANRAKSWSCEHCENWKLRDANICKSCYWAYPESYTHVAMQEIRRLDIMRHSNGDALGLPATGGAKIDIIEQRNRG